MATRDQTRSGERLDATEQRLDNDSTPPWLGLNEAAARLGITVDALRARIKRQNLPTQKGNDGRTRVQLALDSDSTRLDGDLAQAELITELRVELAHAQAAVETAKAVAVADVRAAQAETAAKDTIIAELRELLAAERAALAEARRPWWARWRW